MLGSSALATRRKLRFVPDKLRSDVVHTAYGFVMRKQGTDCELAMEGWQDVL